jgi:hypothetical protein
MAWEIKSVGDDAVTLSDFGSSLMRIITREVESGKFVQEPVMRLRDAQRIVLALKLYDAVKYVSNNA